MTKKCFYCGDALTEGHFLLDKATMIGQNRYAHTDCIDSHGKEDAMNDQTQHILGAADSAHQGVELARSLLRESLGNMGEILTQGCESLGTASLGSTMRLGQKLKELSFVLDDLLKDAHGLCILLGHDLGVCEGGSEKTSFTREEWHGLPPVSERPEGLDLGEWSGEAERHGEWVCEDEVMILDPGPECPSDNSQYLHDVLGIEPDDFAPGKDEFDGDEIPF